MSRVKGRGGKSGTCTGNERDEVTSRFQIPPIQHNNEGQTSVDLGIDDEPCLADLVVGVNRAVGDMARLIANYLGHVLRTIVSFRDGTWDQIAAKHGPAMSTKMKDKFKPKSGMNEHTFEGYCVMALRKAFRTWKNTLHVYHYKKYDNDEDRLKHQLDNRDPETGELAPPDRVWEKQHARKKMENGCGQIHSRKKSTDEILQSVLGERSGHVRGKGCGANPIDSIGLLNSMRNASIRFAGRTLNKPVDWLAKALLLRMCPLDWVCNPTFSLAYIMFDDLGNFRAYS
ncbi:uncharacterized protein G2W53_007868 [Senna tora]|uniref:Uncharacterized protein n=1 Tax=Senna tora TaxID=362788 RepID=A0A835CFB2_9FABA|nr:uncharacterized protein G2W53_007868 [Senna tora]